MAAKTSCIKKIALAEEKINSLISFTHKSNEIIGIDSAGPIPCKLVTALGKKKLDELKKINRSCGVSPTGNKKDLALELVSSFQLLETPPSSIVSIDIGLRNLAYSKLIRNKDSTLELSDWKRVDVLLSSTYSAPLFASQVKRFCASLPIADIYIIEKQYHRASSLQVVETIFRTCILEAQIHCFLHGKCYSVFPQNVATFFDLGEDKKKTAVHLASLLLEGVHPIKLKIPNNLKEMFANEKKKDDLSDSLLQGLAYHTWIENLKTTYTQLTSQLDGSICEICKQK